MYRSNDGQAMVNSGNFIALADVSSNTCSVSQTIFGCHKIHDLGTIFHSIFRGDAVEKERRHFSVVFIFSFIRASIFCSVENTHKK